MRIYIFFKIKRIKKNMHEDLTPNLRLQFHFQVFYAFIFSLQSTKLSLENFTNLRNNEFTKQTNATRQDRIFHYVFLKKTFSLWFFDKKRKSFWLRIVRKLCCMYIVFYFRFAHFQFSSTKSVLDVSFLPSKTHV